MSNVVKKGDFLVFVGANDEVQEFFISSAMFDLDNCHTGITGRKLATIVLVLDCVMAIFINL